MPAFQAGKISRISANGNRGGISVRAIARRRGAVRRALHVDLVGADHFIIANADSVMTRPSADLMAEVFPNVPMRGAVSGTQTLLSIEKARRVLGYEPESSWREARVCPAPYGYLAATPRAPGQQTGRPFDSAPDPCCSTYPKTAGLCSRHIP